MFVSHCLFTKIVVLTQSIIFLVNLAKYLLGLNLTATKNITYQCKSHDVFDKVGVRTSRYVCVRVQVPLHQTFPLHFFFFFFFIGRELVSGTCPHPHPTPHFHPTPSAVVYCVLWELSDPQALSIYVFVKLFSIGRSSFARRRTL